MRSLLFVPGDSERKIAKALASAADALILDLEDAVAVERKEAARALCLEVLSQGPQKPCFVRINGLDRPEAVPDLAAIVRGRPFGIMLPKSSGMRDLLRLGDFLTALEIREGIEPGRTQILPVATETAASVLGLAECRQPVPRLFGMLWGGEDLAADIGALSNRDETGAYAGPYRLARDFCLLAATAASCAPIDAVFTDFRDLAGLQEEARAAARDGFTAKAAIHPDQVEPINAAFTPTPAQVSQARRIVAAFEVVPGSGVAALDGRMLDRPHHRGAMRLLARAEPEADILGRSRKG